jgi:hypothetical protein
MLYMINICKELAYGPSDYNHQCYLLLLLFLYFSLLFIATMLYVEQNFQIE